MIIIGLIEARLFITGYFLVNNQANVNKKIAPFEIKRNLFTNGQDHGEQKLKSLLYS